MKKRTLVMTGGGTAGHVLPCLALLPYLKNEFSEIHFIGSSSGYEKRLTSDLTVYHGIDAVKLARGNPFKMLPVPFKLMKAKRQAAALLKEIKPDAIFSKGGYVALPVVLASEKIPVYLHESDITMGLANKLSLKKCRYIFTSFDSFSSLDKAICTGSPIRQSLYYGNALYAASKCGFAREKKKLLIVGGSSGAAAINEAVYAALDALCEKFNVIHITGENKGSRITREGYFSLEFTDRIEDFFAYSDFVISRGGSGTLFELMALKKPTLIIPLPKGASRGDQVDNAAYFTDLGAAMTLSQDRLGKNSLVESVLKLAEAESVLKAGMSALKNVDGTRKIANIMLDDLNKL